MSPLKGGVCVSTVSIVGRLTENLPDLGKADQVGVTISSQTHRPRGGGPRPNPGCIIADAADGADDVAHWVVGCRTRLDRPSPSSPDGFLTISGNPKAVAVRIRIDFDDDLFNGSARCLAAPDRSHRNEASRLQLCERAREVRLGPPSHLHQFDN